MSTLTAPTFGLPDELIAESPPEARGIARDEVRMLVASRATGELVDTTFRDLPEFVAPGDLLVVNTSATVPAAVETDDGRVAISRRSCLTVTAPGGSSSCAGRAARAAFRTRARSRAIA